MKIHICHCSRRSSFKVNFSNHHRKRCLKMFKALHFTPAWFWCHFLYPVSLPKQFERWVSFGQLERQEVIVVSIINRLGWDFCHFNSSTMFPNEHWGQVLWGRVFEVVLRWGFRGHGLDWSGMLFYFLKEFPIFNLV